MWETLSKYSLLASALFSEIIDVCRFAWTTMKWSSCSVEEFTFFWLFYEGLQIIAITCNTFKELAEVNWHRPIILNRNWKRLILETMPFTIKCKDSKRLCRVMMGVVRQRVGPGLTFQIMVHREKCWRWGGHWFIAKWAKQCWLFCLYRRHLHFLLILSSSGLVDVHGGRWWSWLRRRKAKNRMSTRSMILTDPVHSLKQAIAVDHLTHWGSAGRAPLRTVPDQWKHSWDLNLPPSKSFDTSTLRSSQIWYWEKPLRMPPQVSSHSWSTSSSLLPGIPHQFRLQKSLWATSSVSSKIAYLWNLDVIQDLELVHGGVIFWAEIRIVSGNDEVSLVLGVCRDEKRYLKFWQYLPQSGVGMMEKVHQHHCWMPEKRWWSSHYGDEGFSSAVTPIQALLCALFALTIALVASWAHGQAPDNHREHDEAWVGCEEVPIGLSQQQLWTWE